MSGGEGSGGGAEERREGERERRGREEQRRRGPYSTTRTVTCSIFTPSVQSLPPLSTLPPSFHTPVTLCHSSRVAAGTAAKPAGLFPVLQAPVLA